ncbi:MAG TPA: hypothetical protein VK862_05650 [Afifellaceae bacterium]|nr:hypothetical protein [Afifellaceae bacterium]
MHDTTHPTGRTAALWLGTGAALLAAALVFHGPIDTDLSVQMQHIAEGHSRWAMVHWTAATALFLLSGAGFLTLFGRAEGAPATGHPGAWMVMALGALTTFSTAVAEAAVVSAAARTGDQAAFNVWWDFSGGMANGFFALALAAGLIAWADFRAEAGRLPKWASMAGTAAGFLSAAGWSLGQHFGIWIGGPLWLFATLAMCLWLAWFGFAARIAAPQARQAVAQTSS